MNRWTLRKVLVVNGRVALVSHVENYFDHNDATLNVTTLFD